MTRYASLSLPLFMCVAACSSGPPVHTYVLARPLQWAPPVPTSPLAVTPLAAPEQIALRRVSVPDYLDTTDILLRDGRNEVKASATGRWGERLSEGLTHALAADLAARLPQTSIVLNTSGMAHQQLLIEVNALDLWGDGRCLLAATWSIADHDAPRSVMRGSGIFDASPAASEISAGDAGLVDAISRAVGKLADAVALKIKQSSARSSSPGD